MSWKNFISIFCLFCFSEGYVFKIGVILNKSLNPELYPIIDYKLSSLPLPSSYFKVFPEELSQFAFKASIKIIPHFVDISDSYMVANSICQLMNEGIIAIYGLFPMATNDVIKSYSNTFHLPFINSEVAVNGSDGFNDLPLSLAHHSFQLYIRPLYAKAIVDFLIHYNWNTIWYLFESDEGLQRVQQILDCLSENNFDVRIHLFKIKDAEEAVQTLSNLNSKIGIKIFLDLSTENCEKVLQLQNRDTNGMLQNYFIVGLGIGEIKLDAFNIGGMNVSGFRLIDPSNSTVKSFIRSWYDFVKKNPQKFEKFPKFIKSGSSSGSKISFETALTIDALTTIQLGTAIKGLQIFKDFPNFTVNCDEDPPKQFPFGHDFMRILKSVEFQGLTGKVKFDRFGHRTDYKLDVLEVSQSRALAKIGSWTLETGITIQPPDTIRPFKGNNTIANRTRIVTSILTAPYLMSLKNPDGSERTDLVGNAKYEGYCADLTNKIASFVGFDYVIKPVEDGTYGTMENNTWNGMVGELMKRKADLAIAPLTITAARESAIDFSKPFMSLGISIMIKRMKKDTPSVFSFMNPLSYEIWMCVIFAYIGVSVVLFLVSRFSPFEWHIEDHTDGPSVTNNFTIFNSLWFSLGAFMQQGCDIEPRSVSGRIVGSVWWFFTLIIISSYTANLAAFLTVERMQSPIESAEDLAKQTEIKYGMVDSGSTMEFFKKSTIPVYERMWAFMTTTEPTVFVKSNEEGIERVRAGKYAFLIESTTNDYINQMNPCNTMKVGSNLDSKGYGVGTPTGSDLRDRITLAVLELSENEELANLEKTWWYDKTQCHHGSESLKKQELTSSLELANVAGIFYILLGGLSLALIMALVEFLYKSKVEARRRKTTFSNAVKSKARLSITGMPERQTTSYAYAPAAQLISLDGWTEVNSRTQV